MPTQSEPSRENAPGNEIRAAPTTPLLTTKLRVPPLRPNLVSRSRLIGRLNKGLRLDHRLSLISAPAGFGKTTLLSEWATYLQTPVLDLQRGFRPAPKASQSEIANRVVWLSLDERDNDLLRFLSYLISALQSAEPQAGVTVLDMLQAPGIGGRSTIASVESILAPLINDIASATGFIVLVVDDYHLIKSQPIHDALAFLLDHLPAPLHLVLASRSDPPLPLARLRGRGLLTEIREGDLRFTPDEAAEFLSKMTGLDLAAADVEALESRTEGWITGLQLAAISLQGRDTALVSSFIQALTGSNRYILDYLTEEVLQTQPEHVQSFLLQTSLLKRLCGPLCDAVLGGEGSQRMLERLEANNLFVVPLDDQRRWYRYHRLFADLLQARLQENFPDRTRELLQRASVWHEETGAIEDAVTYAVESRDPSRIGGLVEAHGMPALMRGELVTLQRWIAAVPTDTVEASARLCVLQAWVLLLTGQMQPIESVLQRAEALITPDLDHLRGDIAAIRAYVAAQHGDATRTIELAGEAIALLDESKLGELGVVYFVLGGAHILHGDVAAAAEALAKASAVGQQGGNIHVTVPALNALAGLQIQQGRLHQAQATAQEAIGLATGPSGQPLPFAGGAVSALAEVAYEWNELYDAQAYAQESVDLNQRWGNPDSLGSSFLTLAQVLLARGDQAAAVAALQEAERMGQQFTPTPVFSVQLRTGWVRLWLAQGDMHRVRRWVDSTRFKTPAPFFADEMLALAHVYLALDQADETLGLLGPLLGMAREQGLNRVVIDALVIQALACYSEGSHARAFDALAGALALAEPENHVRCFVDKGENLASLLRRMALQGVTPEFVQCLLSQPRFAGPPADASGPRQAPQPMAMPGLVEPLSERELEVLRLIADGLSNREIADRLVIATSTVKSHANHIYGKLNVQSRTQAIAIARELRLL